jgi:two-component system sensor histidine kinase TtrS
MGEMVTGLAHEINQPLAAIANYASAGQIMLESSTDQPEKLNKVLEAVGAQAMRASEIIRHLRQFVRKQEPQKTLVSLNTIVKEVLSFTQADMRSHSTQVQLELDDTLPEIHADAIQIEQVLVNLVRNSLEAMEVIADDKRHLILRTYLNDNGMVQAEISDSGPGMDKERLGNIFEAFVTTKGAKGMGLGLSISRSIIEAHGGRLWVESEQGKGAVFFFTLPLTTG